MHLHSTYAIVDICDINRTTVDDMLLNFDLTQ
jgi:hypothetical protein